MSSTYKYLNCASQQCQSLGACPNNDNNVNCTRTQEYGDKSEVDELTSSETLTVGSQPVEDFVFGCASAASGLIQRSPGLVGFGRDALSFVSQTTMPYDKLVSIPEGTFTFNKSTGSGTIIDSGTVITRLVEPAYNSMRDTFSRQLSNLTQASPTELFDTC
ncbi:aspartyl protease AED1-like [Cryptomeria japonica]|uniref:aspartyl protease AED1-like n=1 Tax=Cryptomeria japonica TaxID=3369 RepID=UPI0025ABE53C|nr:aspartyl protease AED1-like [Cryptomeria japonica]